MELETVLGLRDRFAGAPGHLAAARARRDAYPACGCGNENGRRDAPTVHFPNHKQQGFVKEFRLVHRSDWPPSKP
jgi:hypothetical protein